MSSHLKPQAQAAAARVGVWFNYVPSNVVKVWLRLETGVCTHEGTSELDFDFDFFFYTIYTCSKIGV